MDPARDPYLVEALVVVTVAAASGAVTTIVVRDISCLASGDG